MCGRFYVGGVMRVTAWLLDTHYRGSERTHRPADFFCRLLLFFLLLADFPPLCWGVGVGGCVLFEKWIVDASILTRSRCIVLQFQKVC